MLPAPVTLSFFLLFVFITKLPLVFSANVEQVLDKNGVPISQGGKYFILPTIQGPLGGGVRIGLSGNSKCPVTVLQDDSETIRGVPVKFSIAGKSSGNISTGTPLDIEFTEKPFCAESSKWMVFVDNDIKKTCVGIGGLEDHPGKKTLNGTFNIQKYQQHYKLVFCVSGSSPTCFDISTYHNGLDEGGNRLSLNEPLAFEFMFMNAT